MNTGGVAPREVLNAYQRILRVVGLELEAEGGILFFGVFDVVTLGAMIQTDFAGGWRDLSPCLLTLEVEVG